MKNFLSRIAVHVILLTAIWSGVFAQNGPSESIISPSLAKEETALRDGYTKHFVTPDGKNKAYISSRPIHYLDKAGNWQNIDCSLQPSSSPAYLAENTTNTIASYFPEDGMSGVKIQFPDAEIKMGINPTLKIVKSDGSLLTVIQQKSNIKITTSGNTMAYDNFFHQASITYNVGPNEVKNNLILNSIPDGLPQKDAFLAYSEVIELPSDWNLSCKVGHENQEVYVDGGFDIVNNRGERMLAIPTPDVFEQSNPSNGVHNDGNWKNNYKVKNLGQQKYEITTMVPVEWLNDPSRNYPVVVDPTVSLDGNYGGWQNTLGQHMDGNATIFVFTGLNTNGATYKAYTKFDLSSIPTGAVVTDTRLQVEVNNTGNNSITETIFVNDVTGGKGPYGAYDEAVYQDLGDGAYTSFDCTGNGTYGFFDLGSTADVDVMKNLCSGSFQVGFSVENPTTWKRFTSYSTYLEVTYTERDTDITASSPTFPNGHNVGCHGDSSGVINISVPAGSSFSYSWTGPNGFTSTDENPNKLAAGTYDLIATDLNGACVDTLSIVLTEPDELILTDSISSYPGGTNISCNGATDGTITVSVSGGSDYTYSWTGPAGFTSFDQNPKDLAAGTYDVTVTEGVNSCTASGTFILTEPTKIDVDVVQDSSVTCHGLTDGGLSISSTSGGTAPYTYEWTNGSSDTFIAGVSAGTYTATVTDTYGCKGVGSGTITEPDTLTASVSVTNASCNGVCDGTATVDVSGGTAPYSYLWSNGSTDADLSSLCAGNYSVTVTDANGCTTADSKTVAEPEALIASVSVTNASCNGVCDGTATVDVSGGTAPYSYLWSNGSTDADLSSLCADTYSVAVTDATGCSSEDSDVVAEPDALNPEITQIDDTLYVTPAATYQWMLDDKILDGETNPMLFARATGSYSVVITGTNGCQETSDPFEFTVSSISNTGQEPGFSPFPNPAGEKVKIDLDGFEDCKLTILDSNGRLMQSIDVKEKYCELNTGFLAPGVYYIKISNGRKTYVEKLMIER